jgi:hypothetical protein
MFYLQSHQRNTNKPAVQADDQRQAVTEPTVEEPATGLSPAGRNISFHTNFQDEVKGDD